MEIDELEWALLNEGLESDQQLESYFESASLKDIRNDYKELIKKHQSVDVKQFKNKVIELFSKM